MLCYVLQSEEQPPFQSQANTWSLALQSLTWLLQTTKIRSKLDLPQRHSCHRFSLRSVPFHWEFLNAVCWRKQQNTKRSPWVDLKPQYAHLLPVPLANHQSPFFAGTIPYRSWFAVVLCRAAQSKIHPTQTCLAQHTLSELTEMEKQIPLLQVFLNLLLNTSI